MRMFVPILLSLTLAGCAPDVPAPDARPVPGPVADAPVPDAPTFRDEAEELAYLESQANPSIEQFRRREALRAARARLEGRTRPEPGDVVTLPDGATMYATRDEVRAAWRAIAGIEGAERPPALARLEPGAAVRVVEVGDDHARVEATVEGEPITGLALKWWPGD